MVTNGNRFIERDYHKVKEWVQMGHIEPRHVPGVDNPADLFTKSVVKKTIDDLLPYLYGEQAITEDVLEDVV